MTKPIGRRRKAKHRKIKCRIDQEWGGIFIGRRYCSTHKVYWDEDNPICPKAR